MTREAMKQALEALGSYMEATDSEADAEAHSLMAAAFFKLKEAVAEAEKQEPVALEAVYETIIHWDEGGGKRSRRELARRIVDLYTTPPAAQPAPVQEPVAWDAEQWGNRLNDASWAAIEAWNKNLMGPMHGAVFNNIKGVVRAAILKYLEGYTTPPAAQRQPLIDSVRHMRDIQGVDGTWNYDPYMHGLYNGLEFALSLLEVREPQFKDAPKKWLCDLPKPRIFSATEAAHGIKEKNT